MTVVGLVAFLAGQQVGRNSVQGQVPAADAAGPVAPFASGGGGGPAPDISKMTPEERATRLFDRVMRYGEEGKQDSARVFAPMAIQAYEMIGTLNAHHRYDMGLIGVVAGDVGIAQAQADTILATNKSHLLGLVLAMKAAGLRQDLKGRDALKQRLLAAKASEEAKQLPEYQAHKPDIDAATKNTKP
jgi:hypothetical protein